MALQSNISSLTLIQHTRILKGCMKESIVSALNEFTSIRQSSVLIFAIQVKNIQGISNDYVYLSKAKLR